MNREEIKKYLPHREPMLLVDEVSLDSNGIGHGIYTIKEDDFFCYSPAPGIKIVPGSILCEIMAQTCISVALDKIHDFIPMYTTIDKVVFNEPVKVGDKCMITARKTYEKGPITFCDITLEVDRQVRCSGSFSCALVPRENL